MEKKIFNISTPIDCHGYRIDKFLQSQFNNLSRTRLQNLIRDGYVKINDAIIQESSKKIKNDDKIEIKFPLPKETSIKPYKMPLDILYDDSDLVIINKSPGVVIHPGAGNYEKTLVNGLLFKFKQELSSVGGRLRPGIVHRIDKDTSGAIVVAKNDNAHINLSKQFSDHTIKRTYEVLVWGSLKPLNGTITERISRSLKNRQLMSVRKEKGKLGITNYKTVKVFQNIDLPKISLLECQLKTGRTHQIRVHMNFKGNSVVGDKSYGKLKKKFKKINPKVEKMHAKSLGFIHPRTKKDIFFQAKRPEDFDELIKNLNKASL